MATMTMRPTSLNAPNAGGSSVAMGLLSMLQENDSKLQGHALQRLWEVVDYQWAAVSDDIATFEELSEDESFSYHELAAAIASKVCYSSELFPVYFTYSFIILRFIFFSVFFEEHLT